MYPRVTCVICTKSYKVGTKEKVFQKSAIWVCGNKKIYPLFGVPEIIAKLSDFGDVKDLTTSDAICYGCLLKKSALNEIKFLPFHRTKNIPKLATLKCYQCQYPLRGCFDFFYHSVDCGNKVCKKYSRGEEIYSDKVWQSSKHGEVDSGIICDGCHNKYLSCTGNPKPKPINITKIWFGDIDLELRCNIFENNIYGKINEQKPKKTLH